MAVIAIPVGNELRNIYDAGIDPVSGRQLYRSRSYNMVKPNATIEGIYEVGEIIGGLCEMGLDSVQKRSLDLLEND